MFNMVSFAFMKPICRLPMAASMATLLSLVLADCGSSSNTSEHVSAPSDSQPKTAPRAQPIPICEAVKSGDLSRLQAILIDGSTANSTCPENDVPVLSIAAGRGDLD